MKKLVLLSEFCDHNNQQLEKRIISLVGKKRPTLGYIPSQSDRHRKYFDLAKAQFERIGFSEFLYFDLDEEYDEALKKQLFQCDAIYLSGGNTFFFLNSLKKRDFIQWIKDYVDYGGVLIGLSAGSILMTPSIEIAGFLDENDIGINDFNSIHLVEFEFMPHWNKELSYEALLDRSLETGKTIFTCEDGGGIVINDSQIEFYGVISKVENGKVNQIT